MSRIRFALLVLAAALTSSVTPAVAADASDQSQTVEMGIRESLSAAGGTMENVEFDPPMQIVDVASGNTVASFAVTMESLMMGSFDTIIMVLGSDSLIVSDFNYSPGFVTATGPFLVPPFPLGIYPSDLYIGGASPTPMPGSMIIGVLEVDAADLPCGDHEVLVDANRDSGQSTAALGLNIEALFGSAKVRVIDSSCLLCDTCGACCYPDGTCQNDITADACSSVGSFHGVGSVCAGDNNGDELDDACATCPIPTVSSWRLAMMVLVLSALAKVHFQRSRQPESGPSGRA